MALNVLLFGYVLLLAAWAFVRFVLFVLKSLGWRADRAEVGYPPSWVAYQRRRYGHCFARRGFR